MAMENKPSIAQALAQASQAIASKAKNAMEFLPAAPEARRTIVSFSDAQACVQEQLDRKLGRKESTKSKSKEKLPPPPDQSFPGAKINGSREGNAFWMLMEDYFRDVTKEDLQRLLSVCTPPEHDDALLVPALGPHYTSKPVAMAPAAAPPVTPGMQPLRMESAGLDTGDGANERKSSRLSARQRGRGDRDSEDGGGLQGALAGAAAPCGAVDAQGRPVARAVDVCAAHELLRMLALWMSLKQLTVAEVAPACQMAPAQLQSLLDASRTDGAQLQLQPAQHDALVAWLEQQSSGLSEAVALAPWQQAVQDAQPEGSAGGSGAQLLAQLASAGGGHSAAAGAGEGRRRLEFSRPHPYLELLLQQAVPAHVADPDSEWVNAAEAAADDAGDGDAPAGSGGQSGAAAGGAQPAEQAGGDGEPPASPQVSQKGLEAGDADAADCGDAAADGSAADAAANATSSGGRGRGRGGRGGRGRGRRGRPPGRGPGGIPRPPKLDEAPSTLVAQAVAALVAAAPPEGALDEQWQLLDSSAPLLAVAPDDEVLAELLALQGELLHQQVVNRARVAVLLERVLSDAPQQAAAAEQWQLVEGEVMGFLQNIRDAKRAAIKEKREMAKRHQLEAAAAALPASPRSGVRLKRSSEHMGRMSSAEHEMGGEGGELASPYPGSPVADAELVDSWATLDDDSVCAVCADGHSEPPNPIVFCERCDLAVHQDCYGMTDIPDGEWLCWPCRQFEERQRQAGVPQQQIRPPRWAQAASGGQQALEGGARSEECALCPVRHGAFKRDVANTTWVHLVCAYWQPETSVQFKDAPDAVEGLARIASRLGSATCSACRRSTGAVLKCGFGHCANWMHPLCARRRGCYLAIRAAPSGGKYQYRMYCQQHSPGMREKDMLALEQALAAGGAALQAPPPNPALLEELARKEETRATLFALRMEFESLRVLSDQARRREKIKRQQLALLPQLHAARLADPKAGLEAAQAAALEGPLPDELAAARARFDVIAPLEAAVRAAGPAAAEAAAPAAGSSGEAGPSGGTSMETALAAPVGAEGVSAQPAVAPPAEPPPAAQRPGAPAAPTASTSNAAEAAAADGGASPLPHAAAAPTVPSAPASPTAVEGVGAAAAGEAAAGPGPSSSSAAEAAAGGEAEAAGSKRRRSVPPTAADTPLPRLAPHAKGLRSARGARGSSRGPPEAAAAAAAGAAALAAAGEVPGAAVWQPGMDASGSSSSSPEPMEVDGEGEGEEGGASEALLSKRTRGPRAPRRPIGAAELRMLGKDTATVQLSNRMRRPSRDGAMSEPEGSVEPAELQPPPPQALPPMEEEGDEGEAKPQPAAAKRRASSSGARRRR